MILKTSDILLQNITYFNHISETEIHVRLQLDIHGNQVQNIFDHSVKLSEANGKQKLTTT